jgi:hypothetical protein
VLASLRSRGIGTGLNGLDCDSAIVTSFKGPDALISHARARAPYAAVVDLTADDAMGKRIHNNLFGCVRDGGVHGTLLEPVEPRSGVLGLLRGTQQGKRPAWITALLEPAPPGDRRGAALRAAIANGTDVGGLVLLTKRGTQIEFAHPLTPTADGAVSTIDLEAVWRINGIRGLATGTESVDVSNDGTEWMPVSVTLDVDTHRFSREVRTRFLRAHTPDIGWTVMARHWDVRPRLDAKFISSRRPDGLGGRLAALLNAIRLSQLLGLDYRFRWGDNLVDDAHHAVPTATQVFSADYWQRHGDADRPIEQQPGIKASAAALGRPHTLDELQTELLSYNGFTVPLERLDHYLDAPGVSDPYSAEFSQIEFAPEIAASLEHARTVELPANAVGLHVRSGDIVFGKYRRYFVHTRKVISYPVAKAVIAELERRGHTVILFGQDEALANDLVSGSNTIKAADLLDGGTPTQQALAEIVLLSRLSMVVARNSLFAEQAASISGIPLIDPIEFFEPQEQVRITDSELADSSQHPLSVAFAYWSAYYVSRHSIDAHEAVRLLARARDADPDNALYSLALAAHHFDSDRADEAEAILQAALDAEFPPEMGTVTSTFTLRMGTWFLLDEYFPAFESAAAAGSELARRFVDERDRATA